MQSPFFFIIMYHFPFFSLYIDIHIDFCFLSLLIGMCTCIKSSVCLFDFNTSLSIVTTISSNTSNHGSINRAMASTNDCSRFQFWTEQKLIDTKIKKTKSTTTKNLHLLHKNKYYFFEQQFQKSFSNLDMIELPLLASEDLLSLDGLLALVEIAELENSKQFKIKYKTNFNIQKITFLYFLIYFLNFLIV